MTEPESQPPTELSLGEALALAVQAHRAGYFDNAEILYRRILELAPDQADAMHFLGVLLHQRDRSDAAIELIEKSIALAPEVPDRYNNLGNVLVERERLAEATEAYERAIALQPAHANAFNNLGAVLKAQGRMDEAAAAYMRAIALDPKHVEAHNNMGSLLESKGAHREACAYYCKALTLMPDNPNAKKLLGVAYYTLGEIDKAAEVFRQWLAEDPGNPVASHMHAACSGENVPRRASDNYIETTFDNFADSFDAKLGYLGYRAPQAVAQAVARTLGAPAKRLVALDAGCGTGLCGPLLAPYVSRLCGVDLSAGMLAKARSRGVYDELVKAELTAYLDAHADAFDLIVSADTLVYFGPLETVFGATSVSLRGDGLLAFTLEEAAEDVAKDGYRINPHGRYSHTRRYVSQALTAAGFAALSIEPTTLRMEGGAPVAGLVVSARKERGIGLQSIHGRV
jgi:predicted TPR repeat methyltransferase